MFYSFDSGFALDSVDFCESFFESVELVAGFFVNGFLGYLLSVDGFSLLVGPDFLPLKVLGDLFSAFSLLFFSASESFAFSMSN